MPGLTAEPLEAIGRFDSFLYRSEHTRCARLLMEKRYSLSYRRIPAACLPSTGMSSLGR